jgi:hypothetical protein
MELNVFEIMKNGDGNAYSIMTRVIKAIKQKGASDTDIQKYKMEATCGNYQNLLTISMDWLEMYDYKQST